MYKSVKAFGVLKTSMLLVTWCQNLLVSYFEIPVIGQNGKRIVNFILQRKNIKYALPLCLNYTLLLFPFDTISCPSETRKIISTVPDGYPRDRKEVTVN